MALKHPGVAGHTGEVTRELVQVAGRLIVEQIVEVVERGVSLYPRVDAFADLDAERRGSCVTKGRTRGGGHVSVLQRAGRGDAWLLGPGNRRRHQHEAGHHRHKPERSHAQTPIRVVTSCRDVHRRVALKSCVAIRDPTPMSSSTVITL